MKKLLLIVAVLYSMNASAQIETTTSKDGYVLYDFSGKEFLRNKKIRTGSNITVLNEFKEMDTYYEVLYKKEKGYIRKEYVAVNEGIRKLIQIRENRLDSIRQAEVHRDSLKKVAIEEAKRKKEANEKEYYGKWYTAIKQKRIVIGMPEKFVTSSWGDPEEVNVSEYSFGIHKQYVYKEGYVYVKNEVVTSIQYKKK